MFRLYIIYLIFLLCVGLPQTKSQGISFATSLQEVYTNSNMLKISEKEAENYELVKKSINSSWMPSITLLGGYTWMSNEISVSQEYKSLLTPFNEYFDKNIITQEIGNLIYNFLGNKSFTVPIIDNQWATLDISLTYPIFTGGKRLLASKIGNEIKNVGKLEYNQIKDAIFVTWVEIYYGYQLSKQYERVREENYNSLKNHFENVASFQTNGIANQMDYLVAKVAMDEAEREWKLSQRYSTLLQYSFCKLMGYDSTCNYTPTSSFFVYKNIPDIDWFIKRSIESNLLKIMETRNKISKNTIKINQSDYLPTIIAFGKQTLASYNMPQNLSPRTVVGATLTWNIFDGLAREHRIKESKIQLEINQNKYLETENQLKSSIHKAYTELLNAEENIKTLSTTLDMTQELVRIRKAAYIEGLATTTEVIDAELADSKIKLLQLSAYYQYDIMLATLLSICGATEYFTQWSTEQ